MITVEELNEIDEKVLEQITEINHHVQQLHYQEVNNYFKTPDREKIKIGIKEKIDNSSRLLVAIEEKKIIGYGLFSIEEKIDNVYRRGYKLLELTHIALLPEKRGLGIGKKIINKIEDIGKIEKVDFIELTVWNFNRDAIQFYRKTGFKEKTTNFWKKL